MFYNEKYVYYRCELRFKDPNFKVLKNTLISILGQPKSTGVLHPFMAINLETGKEDGEGFQLQLSEKNLGRLQKRCQDLNISFDEVFERDWRHYHLQYYIGNDEHEGIAYEHDDYWEIFYEDGSLNELPGLREDKFFIQKVLKKDINNVDKDIDYLFEKWITENIKRIT